MSELNTYVESVKQATEENDHTGAIKLIAMYTTRKHNRLEGIDKLVKCVGAVNVLHDFYGYLPENLKEIRTELQARIFSFLNDEETKAFNAVL